MPKYFVIVPVPGEQPRVEIIEAVDATVAEAQVLLKLTTGGEFIAKRLGYPIVERISPIIGAKYDPDLEFKQMKKAWVKYYTLPDAVSCDWG